MYVLVSQVAVPILMAQTLTYPEKVTRYNIEKLRQCVINGMSKHPGANFVVFPENGKSDQERSSVYALVLYQFLPQSFALFLCK